MDHQRDDAPGPPAGVDAGAVTALRSRPASHRRVPPPSRARRGPRAGGRAELRARRRRRLRRIQMAVVLGVLAMMITVRAVAFQAFFIPSPSMEPTLEIGDRVLVNKLSYRVGEVQRGQVVVFDGNGSFVFTGEESGFGQQVLDLVGATSDEDDFVKRVIGIPGDRVRCCDGAGRLLVNGVPLEEPYLFGSDTPSRENFDVQVPPGRLWVMGDHRSRSADSRAHLGDPGGGTVPLDKVVGRAVAIVWPPSRAGRLNIPDSFERLTIGRVTGD